MNDAATARTSKTFRPLRRKSSLEAQHRRVREDDPEDEEVERRRVRDLGARAHDRRAVVVLAVVGRSRMAARA
jgi:hypothetical protein